MIRFFSSRVSPHGRAGATAFAPVVADFHAGSCDGRIGVSGLAGRRGLRGWQELRAKNKERAIVLAGLKKKTPKP